jgi:hypothetical protein
VGVATLPVGETSRTCSGIPIDEAKAQYYAKKYTEDIRWNMILLFSKSLQYEGGAGTGPARWIFAIFELWRNFPDLFRDPHRRSKSAILRKEKNLINRMNPNWNDLYEDFLI